MTAELYQRAKAIFAELLDANASERAAKLQALLQSDPALEKEVRSLLDYHTAQSLVVPQAAVPRIRTRSTLSTTYQSSSLNWLPLALKFFAVAIPMAIIAFLISAWVERSIQRALSDSVNVRLTEAIESQVDLFRIWERHALSRATSWGQHPGVLEAIETLLREAETSQTRDSVTGDSATGEVTAAGELVVHSASTRQLAGRLMQLAGVPVQFTVWDRRMIPVADWNQGQPAETLAGFVTPAGAARLAPALKGRAQLYLPRPDVSEDNAREPEEELAIVVPITNQAGGVIAALMLRGYGLEAEYKQLQKDWAASSLGEIYLINARGAIITPSRYADRLEAFQLATDGLGYNYPLVRDAGVNLLAGEKPKSGPAAWPPTLLAREVTAGNDGHYVDGYRNYVGEQVVGAWRWLPEHEVGIAVEEHYADAFSILHLVQRALLALNGFFAISFIGLFIATSRLLPRRRLRDLSEVGPYQVQEILGEGGMGRVYLAEHALLCRQSAIKVLTKGATDLTILSRFEREVQLASQLTHPNTIAIYDFGRNKDGVFYYAMEYINGAHLGQLVEYAGPIEPGRTIFILQQLCRALMEAHQAGVVHRDIKPQNIMVCNRGGEPDFVKLFDYGLVKAFAPGVSHNTSQTRVVVGTPRFMAPERLDSPWLADPRVDIYSVGALAYYLLTGKLPPLVTHAGGPLDNEQPGIETLDLPPSVVEFGGILSVCLSVEPASRPSSMMSLLRELDALGEKFPWSRADSIQWWHKHEAKLLHLVHNKRKKLSPVSTTTN